MACVHTRNSLLFSNLFPYDNLMTSNFFQRYALYAVVFLTGSCVLILEVLANRVLSPYYGTTIFTVSSVIGIVLAALSAGYYFGGRLADRLPRANIFYGLILLSGLSVLLLQFLHLFLLPVFGYSFSMTAGPLVFSALLFFLPALLLSTLSPFAVALQHARLPQDGIGQISGSIFFWGTAGSLFGTFLTGFYLIPSFGLKNIITGVALTLLGLGLFGLATNSLKTKTNWPLLLALVVFVSASLWIFKQPVLNPNIVHTQDGTYERVTVADLPFENRPARILFQDATAESGIFLDSGQTAFNYNYYYRLHRLTKPTVASALFIGGGAMTAPRLLQTDFPAAEVEVVEIEPILFDIAHKYFGVKPNPQLHEILTDGRRQLYNATHQYDLIYLDAFHGWNVPSHLTTEEFLNLAKNKLTPNGALVANLIGNLRESEPTYLKAQLATWQKVFPNSMFIAVDDPNSNQSQNIAAAGFNTESPVNIPNDFTVFDNPAAAGDLANHIIHRNFLDEQNTILTDNYAPVEWLLARDLTRK